MKFRHKQILTFALLFILANYSIDNSIREGFTAQTSTPGPDSTEADQSKSTQQESPAPFAEMPVVRQLFHDQFTEESSDNYDVTGAVDFGAGDVNLPKDSKLFRKIEAGSIVEIEFENSLPLPDKDGAKIQLRCWLALENATDSYVQFESKREQGIVTSTIAFFDTNGPWDWRRSRSTQVGEALRLNTPLPGGNWSMHYRYGLWEVENAEAKISLSRYMENSVAEVSGFAIENRGEPAVFNSLKVSGSQCLHIADNKKLEAMFAGSGDPMSAILIHNAAFNLHGAGLFERAAGIYEKANTSFESKGRGKCLNCLATKANLATCYSSIGQHDKAIPIFQAVCDAYESELGIAHPDYGESLSHLAQAYAAKSDFQTSKKIYQQSLKNLENIVGKQHPIYATALNRFGISVYVGKSPEEAVSYIQQAYDTRLKFTDPLDPELATYLSNLAAAKSSMGLYADAKANLQEAIEIQSHTSTKDPEFATVLNNLAEVHRELGEYEQAEPLYSTAINIFKRRTGKRHPLYANALVNLALVHAKLGAFDEALELSLEARTILDELDNRSSPSYAGVLNNLAYIYGKTGDPAEAEKAFLAVKDLRAELLDESHPDQILSLINLGGFYSETKEFQKSEAQFDAAIDLVKKYHGADHPSHAACLFNLGSVYIATDRSVEARAAFADALSIWSKSLPEGHMNLANCHNKLGELACSQRDFVAAEKFFDDAHRIVVERIETYSQIQSAFDQRKFQMMIEKSLDNYFSNAIKSNQFANKAFQHALNWKGSTQFRQREYRRLAATADTKDLFAANRRIAAQLYFHLEQPSDSAEWSSRYKQLSNRKTKIDKQLAQRSASFSSLSILEVDEFKRSIPDGAVLLDYWTISPNSETERDKRLVVFVVKRDSEVALIDLGSAKPVFDAIDNWRMKFKNEFGKRSNELIAANDSAESQTTAQKSADFIRASIWDPVEKLVAGYEHVIVSPYAELGKMPLAALPGATEGSFLIDDYKIATLPVPRLLPELMSEESKPLGASKILLVGDVDYDAPSAGVEGEQPRVQRTTEKKKTKPAWKELTETANEINALETLFSESKELDSSEKSIITLRKQDATKLHFRISARDCNVLHVATHGFFANPEIETTIDEAGATIGGLLNSEPNVDIDDKKADATHHLNSALTDTNHPSLLSGLVFAGANRSTSNSGTDDGILTADEISFLPLDNVDLVTLSACETGLGQAAGGEGLIGIQRAFQVSGANSTVASLWKVDDLATRQLMERFYENMLQRKLGKLDALVEAQRWVSKNKAFPGITRGEPIAAPNVPVVPKGKTDTADDPNFRSHPRYWGAWVLSGDWK